MRCHQGECDEPGLCPAKVVVIVVLRDKEATDTCRLSLEQVDRFPALVACPPRGRIWSCLWEVGSEPTWFPLDRAVAGDSAHAGGLSSEVADATTKFDLGSGGGDGSAGPAGGLRAARRPRSARRNRAPQAAAEGGRRGLAAGRGRGRPDGPA